jgi:hypothetical protein
MGRSIETISECQWYTPNIDGNLADPEPFRVLVKPLTSREAAAVERAVFQAKSTGGKVDIDEKISEIEREFIARNIVEVQNYSVKNRDTGVTVTPKNGRELLEAIDQAPASEIFLLKDLVSVIENHSRLSDESKKKSSGPLSFGPKAETLGGGAAQDAEGMKIQKSPKNSGEGSGTATAKKMKTSDGVSIQS